MLASAAFVAGAAEPLVGTADMVHGGPYDISMSDGVNVKLEWSEGHGVSQLNPPKEWTNEAALNELNSATGLTLTMEELNDMTFVGCQVSNTDTSLTLDFSNVSAVIDVSSPLTIYVFACSALGGGELEVAGLDDYSVSIARPDGKGFNASTAAGYNSFSLFKVTGTLQEDKSVELNTSKKKDHFAKVSYIVPVLDSVPEPTTATLSLLALAGLAARRRRVA